MFGKGVWRVLVSGIVLTACTAAAAIVPESSCNNRVPYERTHFRELLAHNPNDFGNSPGSGQRPVTILANNVTYEQLDCVGFNPHLNVLSATIRVKREIGFSGSLCTNGSLEYVRFWVNYGSDWEDLGYSTVDTHDIANSTDCSRTPTKPLSYTLSIKFEPQHQKCSVPVLPRIRATLSWNELPDSDPFWSPVWGNSLEASIQSLAQSTTPPTVLTTGMEPSSRIDDGDNGDASLGLPDRCPDTNMASEQTFTTDQTILSPLPGENAESTSWEELTCLGLDWGLKSLVATVRVKQPVGYGAGPCNNAVFEYVSFWADWNNTCEWTYLGTTGFNVHDFNITSFPSGGLEYTAVMPVDVRNFSAPCNVTKIGRVRAALAYNTVPPTPPATSARGNFIETHVHLQPYAGPVNPTTPQINAIGNIGILEIETLPTGTGMTIPGAQFIQGAFADPSGPHNRKCPFGGLIIIRGEPIIGHSYRLMARRYPPLSPDYPGVPITNPIRVTDVQNIANPHPIIDPDIDGYFTYRDILQNYEMILSFWYPPPGTWQIRLEMATWSIPRVHQGFTDWYKVLVNDQGPTAHINLAGGQVCGDLTVGATVTGTFDAVSPYFDRYFFEVLPRNLNPNPVIVPSAFTNPLEPVPPPGSTWSLTTNGAMRCGYVVRLWVLDRTVVNSYPASRYLVIPERGFCLR